jgi:NADP-dependent 3-hydroxy acid dehydrogenase YdfG
LWIIGARNAAALGAISKKFGDNVLPLELDVTNPSAVGVAVNEAHGHFGRLDVILTNAGYGLVGALEVTTIDEVRANFDTNVFGTFSTTNPHCRYFACSGKGTS